MANKISRRQNTHTVNNTNDGKMYRIVKHEEKLGVVDETTKKVWWGYNNTPSVANFDDLTFIEISRAPPNYCKEKKCVIGGIGKTIRYVGLVKACAKSLREKITCSVLAVNIPDMNYFHITMESISDKFTLNEEEEIEEYGMVAYISCSSEYLHIVCANIAKTGSNIFMEDWSPNAFECLGIERLDRREEEPRRATNNWMYSYIPNYWNNVPIDWKHLALNNIDEPILSLPYPLRQYVAILRFKMYDEKEMLKHIGEKKTVSGALEYEQTSQLLDATYSLYVEQNQDYEQRIASCLVLYRYLIERGYSGRWVGKYDQNAEFLGNGCLIRQFKNLSQYRPDVLPLPVLSKIYQKDGRLKGKGSKGSRSKYANEEDKYIPGRKMKIPKNASTIMRSGPTFFNI